MKNEDPDDPVVEVEALHRVDHVVARDPCRLIVVVMIPVGAGIGNGAKKGHLSLSLLEQGRQVTLSWNIE